MDAFSQMSSVFLTVGGIFSIYWAHTTCKEGIVLEIVGNTWSVEVRLVWCGREACWPWCQIANTRYYPWESQLTSCSSKCSCFNTRYYPWESQLTSCSSLTRVKSKLVDSCSSKCSSFSSFENGGNNSNYLIGLFVRIKQHVHMCIMLSTAPDSL